MSIWLRSWSISGWLCQLLPCALGMSTAHSHHMGAFNARIIYAHTPLPLAVGIVHCILVSRHVPRALYFGHFSCAWPSGHTFWTEVAWKYSPRKNFMDIFLGHKSLEHCSVGTFFLTIRLNSGVWGKYRGQIVFWHNYRETISFG